MSDMMLISDGEVWIAEDLGEREASVVGQYWNAVKEALATGREAPLAPFGDIEVDGLALETDLDVIEQLAAQGQLGFHEIYAG